MNYFGVVSAHEMQRLEKMAYAEGCSEAIFMENAGKAIASRAMKLVASRGEIHLLIGRGNNGGDGYVAGRYLIQAGYSVIAWALTTKEQSSQLSQFQREAFEKINGEVREVKKASQINFENASLLIDGLLGTGFHGPLTELYREVIEWANQSKKKILSIDIPSGLDATSGQAEVAIMATETCFLGFAKKGAFLAKGFNYVGQVVVADFGLPITSQRAAVLDYQLLDRESLRLPPLVRVRHKYEAGYVVAIAGSPTMPGAAHLSSLAALHSGAGIVRLFYAQGMNQAIASLAPEIIREAYGEKDVERLLEESQRASALFVGPGMGVNETSIKVLKAVFEKIDKPLVVDADALTLIAMKEIPIPAKAIFTPHVGEMKRLLGYAHEPMEIEQLHRLCQEYVHKHQITLVLKGAPTFIFAPDRLGCIVEAGDPGMATAGSGDVLTGLIAGLLAQKMALWEAACAGALIHGLAGEAAAKKVSSYYLTASTLLEYLAEVLHFDQVRL